jgi:hypothetical protein
MSNDFEYQAEQAKVDFQANIGSLLELQAQLKKKLDNAKQLNKPGVYFSTDELQVMDEWLLQTITTLMADYTLIDRTNRLTNKLYQISLKLAAERMPIPKDLTL